MIPQFVPVPSAVQLQSILLRFWTGNIGIGQNSLFNFYNGNLDLNKL